MLSQVYKHKKMKRTTTKTTPPSLKHELQSYPPPFRTTVLQRPLSHPTQIFDSGGALDRDTVVDLEGPSTLAWGLQ
ncbi:hypothetical protein M0R45_017447 [Rubus argutus]|uniref:Uncharacterized protein n=1 Tax=Rubus argutus TaxID=59490 RepID=A0AAW1XWG0_RUBAR